MARLHAMRRSVQGSKVTHLTWLRDEQGRGRCPTPPSLLEGTAPVGLIPPMRSPPPNISIAFHQCQAENQTFNTQACREAPLTRVREDIMALTQTWRSHNRKNGLQRANGKSLRGEKQKPPWQHLDLGLVASRIVRK